jgi:isopenicillin N synthase-like dioxygenase
MEIIPNNLEVSIKFLNDTAVISIIDIAQVLEQDIEKIKNIILKKKKKFKKLGFLSLLNETSHFVCYLNERQIYLLFSYLEQNEKLLQYHQILLEKFSAYKRKKSNQMDSKKMKELFKIAKTIITDKNIERIYHESM